MSNGAFMAHRMGVDAGDQVAVLAAVAGGPPGGGNGARSAEPVEAADMLSWAAGLVPRT